MKFKFEDFEWSKESPGGRCLVYVEGFSIHSGMDIKWLRQYIDYVYTGNGSYGINQSDFERIMNRGDFTHIEKILYAELNIRYPEEK